MANAFIHRRANTLRETSVAKRRRISSVLDDHVVNSLINLICSHTRLPKQTKTKINRAGPEILGLVDDLVKISIKKLFLDICLCNFFQKKFNSSLYLNQSASVLTNSSCKPPRSSHPLYTILVVNLKSTRDTGDVKRLNVRRFGYVGRDRAARRHVSWFQTFSLAINHFINVSLDKAAATTKLTTIQSLCYSLRFLL